jgi:uncharacterized OB-fold protein
MSETVTSGSLPRVLPAEDDHDTAGFWAAARRKELVVRVCDNCGTVLHMPRAYCNHCGSWEGRWKQVSGRGRLHSWTTVTHQVHPSFPVPYTVVLVQLEDEPSVRYVGNIPGAPELHEGQALEVWFEELEDGVTIPQWRPVD